VSLKSFQFVQSGGGGGGTGTVTQINTAGPITGGPITSTGTINLAASGVTANTYGNATVVPVITVDTYGRITSAANVTISSGTGSVTNVATGAGLTGGPITTTGTISLATSGVTANTYGNATVIPVLTVDTYGRITSASNVTISAGGTGTVTNVATDANLTGGPITTSGTIGLANVISFVSGNVTTTNSNVGTAIVNINTLNAAVNGLNAQIPVNYASTANLSVTYNNGASGVGATLTATTNGVFSLDGASPAATQRVLIKDQTANLQNGVYTVTVVGTILTPFILTRATDYDQSSEIAAGDGFYVISGSTLNNTTWVQQTPAPVTLGTTGITFLQFGAGGAPTGLPKQPYTANTALYANSSTTLTLGVLPVTAGGTGANTAVTALNNLGGVSTGKAIAMAIVFGG
jgi:hypothetical protein